MMNQQPTNDKENSERKQQTLFMDCTLSEKGSALNIKPDETSVMNEKVKKVTLVKSISEEKDPSEVKSFPEPPEAEGIKVLEQFTPKVDTVYLKIFPDNHPLSVEEQIFYLTITEGIFGFNEQIRNENLKLLAFDYNVKSLLPYLTTFIKQTIHVNIAHPDLTLLIYAVRMVKSLLNNKHLNLAEHLHDLIPAVLSCILSRRISKYYYDNHWTLRDFSVFVVSTICEKYNNQLNNITNRVLCIYLKPLVGYTEYPLTTIYGAIKGLGCLGEEVVKTNLYPHIFNIGRPLFILLERQNHNFYIEDKNNQFFLEAKHVRDGIVSVIAPILYRTNNTNDGGLLYSQYFGYLGCPLYTEVKKLEKIEFEKQNPLMYQAATLGPCMTDS